MCNCKNIEPQTAECYSNMITVDIPEHMADYKNNRLKDGLSDKISIDPCIYDELMFLWSNGVKTYGSCCGHNKKEPFVNVAADDIQKMLELGYKQNHPDNKRKDTFKLKSTGNSKWLNDYILFSELNNLSIEVVDVDYDKITEFVLTELKRTDRKSVSFLGLSRNGNEKTKILIFYLKKQ